MSYQERLSAGAAYTGLLSFVHMHSYALLFVPVNQFQGGLFTAASGSCEISSRMKPVVRMAVLLLAGPVAGWSAAGCAAKARSGLSRLPTPRAIDMGNMSASATGFFEGVVRNLTGDEDYEFGQYTKKAISDLTDKATTTGRAMTGDDQYEFGDLTKQVVSDLGKGATVAGRAVLGREDYQFGDISRSVISSADRTLSETRDAYFRDLPSAIWRQLFDGLNKPQEDDLKVALVQYAALALLSYSLAWNVNCGGTIVLAWAITSRRTGLSPLYDGAQWATFLNVYNTIRLGLEPILLPVRVLGAAWLSLQSRRALLGLQRRLPLRERHPILNRALALVVMWLLGNVLAVAVASLLGIWSSSVLTGVPVFA